MNRDVLVCFVDSPKVFDNVKHGKLIKLLKHTGLDYKDIRIIGNLYWNQLARLKINGNFSENIQIKKICSLRRCTVAFSFQFVLKKRFLTKYFNMPQMV